MLDFVDAAEAIRNGEKIEIGIVKKILCQASAYRKNSILLEKVTGHTIIIGPVRGHATDLANYLLGKVLPNDAVENIVFLGNYIDGAHQSIEVLYLVAMLVLYSGKRIVPLIGKHELLYPIQTTNFGSLRNELILRSFQSGECIKQYEEVVKSFFSTLSIACVINGKFFCVAGGPATEFRYLSKIEAASSREELREFVVNEQMDEDEERIVGGRAFVASLNEDSFRFTFNAVCNFISRNNLAGLVVGMEYHTNRPDYDSFARPNHYKESIYFPGYIFGRIHPDTKIPSILSIFSAPFFCDVNCNNACLVEVRDGILKIQELGAYDKRAFIMPGSQDHAFSWAQPMLENAVTALVREIIFGTIIEPVNSCEDDNYCKQERIVRAKMLRMCQLLKVYNLSLPSFLQDKDVFFSNTLRKMSRLGAHYSKCKTLFLTVDLQTAFRERICNFANCVFVANRMANFHEILPQYTKYIATEQYPKGLGGSVSELIIPPSGHLITKTRFSCIVPETEKHLEDVNSVTICGIESHVCVLQTVADLLNMKKRVFVLVDGIGSQREMDRKTALKLMRTWGPDCVLTTSESFLLQMIQDAKDPEFKKVSKLLLDKYPVSI